MKPERWPEIKEILKDALECDEIERRSFLDTVCATDATLRREVEAYLAARQQADDFLDTPAIEVVATLVTNGKDTKATTPFTGESDKPGPVVPGSILDDRYEIENEIGRGGIGIVYQALDLRLGNRVVVKVLIEKALASHERKWIKDKFQQEIGVIAKINHPGVVVAIDVGKLADGNAYLVMQYIPGSNLRHAMAGGKMDLARAGGLIRQLGQALGAVHERNVIHRDLKPENILLQQEGGVEYVKIIDFGIAKVLAEVSTTGEQSTMVVGTPAYMAPEQLRGHPTIASDMYALGVIAYEILTGRLPFETDNMIELARMQRESACAKPCQLRPQLPAAAEAAILKALTFDQRERYDNAREFGEELANALTVEEKASQPPELELAHVLFTDLVGYSRLPIEEQTRLLRQLQEVASATSSLQQAQQNRRVLLLPTGDGMALAFFDDPLAPVRCAIEIARALKSRPKIRLRMGIHTGPVQRFADINKNLNIAGGGINFAQRVMDCGDAGHILLSKTVADVLGQLSEWDGALQDWGEQTVKHGVKLHIFNLYTGEAGNPELPAKLRPSPPPPPIVKRVAMLLLAALLMAAGIKACRYAINDDPPVIADHGSSTISERQLSYSLRVQRNPNLNPGSKPFDSDGAEITFRVGDQARLNVSSPQSGYLYVINEGPEKTGDLPEFIVLFPATTVNGGSALIPANQPMQIPSPSDNPENDWLIFDEEEGVEKIWLIWSERSVPELEDVKGRANPKEKGEISDPRQIESVKQYLKAQSAINTEIATDRINQQTKLKGKGSALVFLIGLLKHR
jgi:serine/threonine protein kinase